MLVLLCDNIYDLELYAALVWVEQRKELLRQFSGILYDLQSSSTDNMRLVLFREQFCMSMTNNIHSILRYEQNIMW